MSDNQLPDVGEVVHAVALLHQNLLCIPAAEQRLDRYVTMQQDGC